MLNDGRTNGNLFVLKKWSGHEVPIEATFFKFSEFTNSRQVSDLSKCKIFELSNLSINETLSRTIITSLTTLLALFSIFFFGGEILKGFAFAMILGVVLGTYSSIFIANPVLVYLRVSYRTIVKEED